MGRRATGQVVVRETKEGRTFALRFQAYGERRYVTLGGVDEGWDRARADEELANVMADVRRGTWRPRSSAVVKGPAEMPNFHEFASTWLNGRRHELATKTVSDYEWALSLHLLPFFAGHPLDAITVEEVDRYKTQKISEGRIAPNAINKTLTRLAQVLEVAVEYGHIDRNPAKGRRRRVKPTKPERSWVEPEQLPSLLDAADDYLRPVLSTLAGAGLRVGEAVALNWGDINLATGTLVVRSSKTDAGTDRRVDLPGGLVEEFTIHKQRASEMGRGDAVFVNRRLCRQTSRNVQARMKGAIRSANQQLGQLGIEPISESVTPHSLRRTYASLRAALRDDPVYIAEQLGHEDARFTFRIYQRAAKRRTRLDGRYATEFDRASAWGEIAAMVSMPRAEDGARGLGVMSETV